MNQKLIRELGFVIFLRIKPETVIKRLKNDKSRPLLQGENPEEKIAELLLQRSSIYENLADVIIDVDELSILEILQKIITNLGGAYN